MAMNTTMMVVVVVLLMMLLVMMVPAVMMVVSISSCELKARTWHLPGQVFLNSTLYVLNHFNVSDLTLYFTVTFLESAVPRSRTLHSEPVHQTPLKHTVKNCQCPTN